MASPLAGLREYLAETEDYRRIFDHLRYDQQTTMPDGATVDRARQLGLMERQQRSRLADPKLGELIAAVERVDLCPDDDFAAWALTRTARRDHETARKRPVDVLADFQVVASEAFLAWREARTAGRWADFAPWLRRLADLNLRMADAIGYPDHPMDALLSLYEPGLSYTETDRLLTGLREPVLRLNVPRLARYGDVPARVPELGPETSFAFVRELTERIGYDWDRGGLAVSPHPFTSPSGANDVRFTLRDDVPFDEMLTSAVHEIGHALYEQGTAPELWGTSAARGVMPWVHESQSKFWENIVGRTPEFARFAHRVLTPYLSERPGEFTAESLHNALVARPTSVIRIGTDELTFNLHILLRWEVETRLLDGTLHVDDVPDLWNARSAEYFGAEPATAADGALQDPHWCHRWMGLFTSYVIGNLLSAQLADAMRRDGVDIEADAEAGQFGPMLGWLRTYVHYPGRTFTLAELVPRATGSDLDDTAYLSHLDRRYAPDSEQESR